MNMCPSQVSPPRTPGSNEYVPLAGVPSKNTRAIMTVYPSHHIGLRWILVVGCGDRCVVGFGGGAGLLVMTNDWFDGGTGDGWVDWCAAVVGGEGDDVGGGGNGCWVDSRV
ncbi:hypothetical protein Tco_0001016 [Tanacetum coccineum]